MFFYIIRRVLMTIPVMAVVALFVFSLLYIAPGDPALIIAGDQATPQQVEHVREALGLDRPYIVRFGEWLVNVLHGDLGTSIFTGQPVTEMIGQRLAPTISLLVFTMLFCIVVAVPLGVVAAARHNSWVDRLVMMLSVVGYSVPVFVIGYAGAYFFALRLGWFPIQGYKPMSAGLIPFLRSMVLPGVSLGLAYIALIARVTRSTMLDVLRQDYVRTAKAKGVGSIAILFVHALKNSAVPIVTVAGIGVGALIGGAVVTETVFAIPGVGRLIVDAILRRDYPIIQGVVLLFSAAYVIINLLVDLLYTLLDPRIRY